ncbi:MAG: hypothetical protein J5529_01535 [Prevotella sp.]|nr:hypothetical protein [Prevotella sp.]
MRKKLLLTALAVVSVMGSFAYEVNEYIFTSTQRLKVTGTNIVTNGDFADGVNGWYDAEKAAPSAETWSVEPGMGPNGESVIKSLGATEGAAFCNEWQPGAGTYVISFQVKGEAGGAFSLTATDNNYANFFVNGDGSFVYGSGTGVDTVYTVASTESFNAEWKTISYTATIEDNQHIVMHLEKFVTGTMITNIEIYPVLQVYDTRIIERKLAYADMLLARPEFVNDGEDFRGTVAQIHAMLEENNPIFDDIASAEDMMGSYDMALNNFLNENSADMFVVNGYQRWSQLGKTQRANGIGPWSGSGGRWFHGDGYAGANSDDVITNYIQATYDLPNATQYITLTNLPYSGTYMLSIDLKGYHMVGTASAVRYTANNDLDFNGVTLYAGPTELTDNTVIETAEGEKVDCGNLDHINFNTYTVFGQGEKGGSLTLGVSFTLREDMVGQKLGGVLFLSNPQIRLLEKSNDDVSYAQEVANIIVQQAEVVKRIDLINQDLQLAKADGYPWGKDALKATLDEQTELFVASQAYVKDEVVLDEDGIRYKLFTEGETKVSDDVLAIVRAMNSARNTFSSLNASYTTLQATVAEADEILNNNQGGNASRRAELTTLVEQAKAMIAETVDGSDGSDKDAFDSKNAEIKEAMAVFLNSLGSYAMPSEQNITNPYFASNISGWTLSANNTSKENFKRGDGADRGAEHGTFAAVWRGETASPQSKFVQTINITDAGVYEYKTSAFAWNDGKTAYDAYMYTVINDEETGVVLDTIFNKSEVKMFFGPNGAPDSVRVHSHYAYNHACVMRPDVENTYLTGYWMSKYSVVYVKETDGAEEVEFGMSSFGQVDKEGANTYGFSDNQLLYCGAPAEYIVAAKEALNALVTEGEAILAANENTENQALQFNLRRVKCRVADAKAVLGGDNSIYASEAQVSENTKTIKNILNARNWLAETIKDAKSIINNPDGISTAQYIPGSDKLAKGVYNIAGVKVADSIEGVKNLQMGIYIINGKKFFVK